MNDADLFGELSFLRKIFLGSPGSHWFRRWFFTFLLLLPVLSMFEIDSAGFDEEALAILVMGVPALLVLSLWTLGWSKQISIVRRAYGSDILKLINFNQLEQLVALKYSGFNNSENWSAEVLLETLGSLLKANAQNNRFERKPITFVEVLINLSTLLLFYPLTFLFQGEQHRNVKVGVCPGKLFWAKVLTVFTGGLYWQYLRYLSDKCPYCNVTGDFDFLVSMDNVSKELESYTEKEDVKIYDRLGNKIGYAETPVQKIRVKSTDDYRRRCRNCFCDTVTRA